MIELKEASGCAPTIAGRLGIVAGRARHRVRSSRVVRPNPIRPNRLTLLVGSRSARYPASVRLLHGKSHGRACGG